MSEISSIVLIYLLNNVLCINTKYSYCKGVCLRTCLQMKSLVISENSFPTSQRKRCNSITKSSPRMCFRGGWGIVFYCSENLTNCAVQTAYGNANTCLYRPGVSYAVCNLPAHCGFHKTPPLAPTLSQIIQFNGHSISLQRILILNSIYA